MLLTSGDMRLNVPFPFSNRASGIPFRVGKILLTGLETDNPLLFSTRTSARLVSQTEDSTGQIAQLIFADTPSLSNCDANISGLLQIGSSPGTGGLGFISL